MVNPRRGSPSFNSGGAGKVLSESEDMLSDLAKRAGLKVVDGGVSLVTSAGGTVLKIGGVIVGALAVDEFMFDGKGRETIQGAFDDPQTFLDGLGQVGESVAGEFAQVGAATNVEGFESSLYEWGSFLADAFGNGAIGQLFTKIANWAAGRMGGDQPLMGYDENGDQIEIANADQNVQTVNGGTPPTANLGNIDLAGVFSSEAFETAMKDEITARYARDSGLNLNDEAQFQATTVSALARIGASDATIDGVNEIFEKGDLSGNFNVSNVEIGPGPTLQNAFAQQADRLFEKGAEAFKTSGGNLDTVATSMTRSLG